MPSGDAGLPPFAEIIWRNEAVKAQLAPIIDRWERWWQEAELKLVEKGYRACNTYHISFQNLQEQIVDLSKRGLRFKPLQLIGTYSGFAHFQPQPRGDLTDLIFGVVYRKEVDGEKFEAAYFNGDHATQGELLGYPPCCIEAFCRWWGAGYYDPILPLAQASECRDGVYLMKPELNVMLRYIGPRMIPFFPCNLKCELALGFADVVKELAKEDNMNPSEMLEILRLPLIWSQVNGIIQVDVADKFKVIAGGYSAEEIWLHFSTYPEP